MTEAEFIHLALSDVSRGWVASDVEALATIGIPDSFLGRRRGMLKGDINEQWARWFVESIADPRRIQANKIKYAYLFEEILKTINKRFSSHEKTQPEKHVLAQTVARIVHKIAEQMSDERQRRRLTFDERRLLLDISGSPPRCWVCGAEFVERAIDDFLFERKSNLELPPFVDLLKPRGLLDRDLRIEVDHVVPFSRGGREEENLELACGWCNRYKSAFLSTYDVEGRPRMAGPNALGIHSLPQPFWVIRLLALGRRCEHPDGCDRTVENAELTVVKSIEGGACNPPNLRITCYEHEHDPLRLDRFQPPSVARSIWGG